MVYNEPTTGTTFTSMKLVIDTKWSDAVAQHVGTYRVELYTANGNPLTLKGPIACDLE